MCVWLIWKLGVGKNGSGISFLPFHLGGSCLMDRCCHSPLCLLSVTVLSFLTFAYVSSFLQGGSLPSQVILEQIPQRRAIPTNTPTMSLWSVTSLLILRGQSSIMWRMIPCLRAVETQVGTYTVDPACLIQFLHESLPRKRNWGRFEMFVMQKGKDTELR